MKPSAWDDLPPKTGNSFAFEPGTSYGRELINMNFKMHYNWVEAAKPSVDARVSGPVKRYLQFAKKKESWRPSLEMRYNKKIDDKWMETLVRKAKPRVDNKLPEYILRYKDYRKRNTTGGENWVHKYERELEQTNHERLLKTMQAATDTSEPAEASRAAKFMGANRFTRGGMDKRRPQSQPGSFRPRLAKQSKQRPGTSQSSSRPAVKKRPQTCDTSYRHQLPSRGRSASSIPHEQEENLPITSALDLSDEGSNYSSNPDTLAAKLAAHRSWRQMSHH